MELLHTKIAELQAMNADENTMKFALKDYGMERANLHGWPNTYVFTKAMGEMLLMHHKDNVPLIIIRPTMVTSTIKDPFPGWIEGLRYGHTYSQILKYYFDKEKLELMSSTRFNQPLI
ncbi:unnamed protein product [Lathyrus oleraceus]